VSSLAGSGSEAIRLCPGHFQTSYDDWRSCANRCSYGLHGFLLSMFLVSRIGVIWSRRTRCGSMRWGTSNGSIMYPILLWSPLRPLLTTKFLSLPTRRLLLSSSGSNSLPTHSISSATSEPKWRLQWGLLMFFQIMSLLALWRASGPSITFCMRWRFHGGGVGVIVHRRIRAFCVFLTFVYIWHFDRYGCNKFTFARLHYFMTFWLVFSLFCVFKFWMNEWMYVWLNECENMNWNEWMDVWKYEWMIKIR